ncbi:uncharacterized protein [Rutidosis leptorrhynchoides]|uniref:uncharacterized protein n=1 Tax=Rutidosis leptorrhynchoides TaxID=125765 RepID=UPI003A9A3822
MVVAFFGFFRIQCGVLTSKGVWSNMIDFVVCFISSRKKSAVSWNRSDLGSRNEELLSEMLNVIGSINLSQANDSWSWDLGADQAYSVACTRSYIDEVLLPSVEPSTRWVKCIPRKINIHIWRLALGRLPTRLNLSRRCVEIQQIGCVLCSYNVESTDHVIFECHFALDIWRRVRIWIDLDSPIFKNWVRLDHMVRQLA